MPRRVWSVLVLLVMITVTVSGSGLVPPPRLASSHGAHMPDGGCKVPLGPGCTVLSPCAPVAPIAAAPAQLAERPIDRAVPALVVMLPASADRSTDHPPPRA